GKAYYGVSSGLLKWELWYSADDKLGTGDTKAMSAKTWSGKNLGIGNGFKNLQGTVGGGFVVTTRASIPKTAKFVCAKLVSASDTNATNNVACAALPTVLWPEYQVKSLKLSVTDIKIGVATKVTVGVQNNGGDSAGVEAVFYASKDMKIDKSDLQAGTGKVGAAKAGALATTELSINLSYKTQAVHKYLCVQVNAKGLALELNQTDNVLCTTMNVINLPDVYVLANQFAFRNKKGAVVGNPKYGEAYGCYASQVYNGGYGAAGEFGVRCWMNKTTAGPTGSLWSESWQHKNGVSAATYTAKKYPGVEKYVYSPTFTNLSKTATLGLHYLCIELNHDKKMSELTYHPKVCRKVNVMGIDLINYPPMTGLKTAKSNTVLPRGQPLYLDYSVCNNGNMQMTGGKAMQSRVLLSKDKNPSADDHLVWSGPYWKDALANGGTKWGGCSGLVAQSFKATLPTSLSPGPMYVIYQVNYDGKFLEPSGNNLTVRAVTIQ
ncbi:MAG: hypothetical protein KC502_15730, partial [Myxococcales bacterium]|nr:hypothetical protein [Myxococcales bacterium]